MKVLLPFALAGLAFTAAQPALAANDASKALAICKNEVAARYGDEARTKIQRIREGRTTVVSLFVRGVGEKSFKVKCKVNGDLQVSSFSDTRPDVAAR